MARRSRRVKSARRPPRKSDHKTAVRPVVETAYQRRIRLYREKHPGASLQEARGKGVEARRGGEHRQRIIKEKRRYGGLTLEQIRVIERRAAFQVRRVFGGRATPSDVAELANRLKTLAREQGYGAFIRYRGIVNSLGGQHRHRERDMVTGRRFTRERLADLAELADEFGLEEEDFWYH